MKFRSKVCLIESYHPDLAIISECENISKITSSAINTLWVGNNNNKGLGIFSFTHKTISIAPWHNPDYQYIVPILYDDTLLFAVWACSPKKSRYGYIEMLYQALIYYNEHIREYDKIIITGDFNSNTIWDKLHRRYGTHSDVVSFLSNNNIESIYHSLNNESQGRETIPTFYLHRKIEKPYHIDYCFISKSLFSEITKIEIGHFEQWSSYSDHVPLFVEF